MELTMEEFQYAFRMSQLPDFVVEEDIREIVKFVYESNFEDDDPGIGEMENNYNYEDNKNFLTPGLESHIIPDTQDHTISTNIENTIVPYNYFNNTLNSVTAVGEIPSNEEFAGTYNFEIILNTSPKYNWVFSSALNKVFINMGQPLPVEFRWHPVNPELYVRATPLFALPQHSQERVVRCLNHSSSSDISNKDVPGYVHQHVIRCNHSKTLYCSNNVDERLSIRTPLGQPQPGTDTVRLMYTFMCKNSCTSGMNRRPLEIVYTLELEDGTIVGRRKHEVRICSCPKRDKDKEEAEYCGPPNKKRKIRSVPPGKKPPPKQDDDVDLTVYTLPSIKIIGRKNAKSTLAYIYNTMAGDAIRHNAFDFYKTYLADIDKKYRSFDQ